MLGTERLANGPTGSKRPPTSCTSCFSTSSFVTSSTNSGIPSVLAAMSLSTSGAKLLPPVCWETMAATSESPIRGSRSSAKPGTCVHGARNSGRHVIR